jgi:lysophospholipase L1-like esterase
MTIVGPDILDGAAVISANTAPTLGRINRYDAAAAARTPALPALSGKSVGARMIVQKTDISTNTVTFTCAGSDTFIDGTSTTLKLFMQGEQRELQVVSISGTKYWKAVGSNTPASSLAKTLLRPHPCFSGVMTRFAHNRCALIQLIGDSTVEFGGWAYPFADTLGAYANASVWVCGWGHTTAEMYDDRVVRSTSTLGERNIFTQSAFYNGPPLAGGNLTVTLKVKPSTSWNSVQFFITKWNDTGNQRGFSFGTSTTSGPSLQFSWSTDGTSGNVKTALSTAHIPFADGSPGWIRAVYIASTATVKFYTAVENVDGTLTWSQLGADVTVAGGTTMFGAPTNPFALCLRGSSGIATGHTFYYTQVSDAAGADLVPRLPEKWDSPYSATTVNGGPTILVMTGGKSGQALPYYDDTTRRPLLLQAKGPDVIIIADGHNDAVTGFGTAYLTYVKHAQFLKPGVPIIATTQNPTKIGSSVTTQATIDSGKHRSAQLEPVLSNLAGVTVLDTHPAYTDVSSLISSDGLHPTSAGYQAQAAYMIRKLVPEAA